MSLDASWHAVMPKLNHGRNRCPVTAPARCFSRCHLRHFFAFPSQLVRGYARRLDNRSYSFGVAGCATPERQATAPPEPCMDVGLVPPGSGSHPDGRRYESGPGCSHDCAYFAAIRHEVAGHRSGDQPFRCCADQRSRSVQERSRHRPFRRSGGVTGHAAGWYRSREVGDLPAIHGTVGAPPRAGCLFTQIAAS